MTYPRVAASGVSAVVAYNDMMAIGLLQGMQQRGLPVPDVLSIAGFDDIFGAEFTTPPLTTVRTSLGELGARAARHLLAEVGALPAAAEPEVPVQTELVLRGSTGTAAGGRLAPAG